jgi:hypothetical protein
VIGAHIEVLDRKQLEAVQVQAIIASFRKHGCEQSIAFDEIREIRRNCNIHELEAEHRKAMVYLRD